MLITVNTSVFLNMDLLVDSKSLKTQAKYVNDEIIDTPQNESNIKNHIRIDTGMKLFLCNWCPKYFYDDNLKMHIRIHTGERPFSCNQCPKSFSRNTNLYIHKRTHSGEKPYLCNKCTQAFTLNGNLKNI